jgi:hypothetical protein
VLQMYAPPMTTVHCGKAIVADIALLSMNPEFVEHPRGWLLYQAGTYKQLKRNSSVISRRSRAPCPATTATLFRNVVVLQPKDGSLMWYCAFCFESSYTVPRSGICC